MCVCTCAPAAGIRWVEARDAAKLLTVHRAAATTKNHLDQNVNSADTEKSWLRDNPANPPKELTILTCNNVRLRHTCTHTLTLTYAHPHPHSEGGMGV